MLRMVTKVQTEKQKTGSSSQIKFTGNEAKEKYTWLILPDKNSMDNKPKAEKDKSKMFSINQSADVVLTEQNLKRSGKTYI